MKDQSRRSMHQVEIADHLWDTFSLMAEQMGSEREALINQALFTFARLNGFLEAGRPAVSAPPEEPAVRAPSAPLAHSGPPVATPLPAPAHVPLPAPRLQKPVDSADGDLHLYLMTEGGELDKITKERFVIGRGKHCDFVINSGKVSREHAVIVREGDAFFIEDLGSSNGTWFNKQRIKRRKIEEGDEYFVCNEKIKLVLR
jgi:hypothetical protein